MPHLLCFGFGFSASHFSARLRSKGWRISATSRSDAGLREISQAGAHAIRYGDDIDFSAVDHVLSSAPPGELGDPVLARYGDQLAARAQTVRWAAYLSTTGVYGNRAGAWVDEDSPLLPTTDRGHRRLAAEDQWLTLQRHNGLPVHLFRLAGIYGPGRNQLLSLRSGTAQRIIKPGQIFSRVHVSDISGILESSLLRPNPGSAYNVCDDEPCPPQDVVAYAAALLGLPVPPDVPFEEATLSPMARSFYAESKRVSNRKAKTELGYGLLYPSYREGLTALARPFLQEPT